VKVLVLGASGMLGHRVARQLQGLELIAPTRNEYEVGESLAKFALTDTDWVVNCIGSIPQKKPELKTLVKVNHHFPHLIATETSAKVIQIATDCAFSGDTGGYHEASHKDARDPYGISKIAGEVRSFMNLRCSIIGPELTGKKSLFEWVRTQPQSARLDGYVNHFWNGVTTDAFARVVNAVISNNLFYRGMHHLIPHDSVSKYQLIGMIAERLGRTDLEITPKITERVNRTLTTRQEMLNQVLWNAAGYQQPPTIKEMIQALGVE
jgi:dTDP-4-dehydrorhamnose reductase